jgi:hypothetical protein
MSLSSIYSMKILVSSFILLFILPVSFLSAQAFSNDLKQEQVSSEHNAWLKNKFSQQHEKLIPIVAVADMFYACNKARKSDINDYSLSELVLKLDKNRLAEKLAICLGDDTMQSDIALNFGLLGCFSGQLAHFSGAERKKKMAVVESAILSLPRSERKKSFTQCVTEQAIHYLE